MSHAHRRQQPAFATVRHREKTNAARRILARVLRTGIAADHAVRRRFRSNPAPPATHRPVRMATLIGRPPDVELFLPLLERAAECGDIDNRLWVLQTCIDRDPAIPGALRSRGVAIDRIVSPGTLWSAGREMRELDAFLNSRESTAGRYRLPDLLTRLANDAGLDTYTLQHGFENTGLTYNRGSEIRFAAKTILIWGQPEQLPAWLPAETRRKCTGVGCPKNPGASPAATPHTERADPRPLVAVFENLQWHRFSAQYVLKFLTTLGDIARCHGDLRFILKSHPGAAHARSAAARSLLEKLAARQCVEVIDLFPPHVRRPSSGELLQQAVGAVTSPSTIALDAALAGVPVAVTRYGLDLSPYRPLPLLDHAAHWRQFIAQLMDETSRAALVQRSARFAERALVPGDAAGRILDLVTAQAGTSATGNH